MYKCTSLARAEGGHMRDDYTDLTVILDRSGSMQGIAADMCGGFDQLIKDQRKLPGKCLVSLRQFDHEQETVYVGKSVHEVPPLELIPRGNTALYDAVGLAVVETGERLRGLPEQERPAKVLVIVITDGHENYSTEYRGAQGASRIKNMIDHQRQVYGWQFIYLGADPTAHAHAADLGIRVASNYTPSPKGSHVVNAMLSNAVGAYRSHSGTAQMDWMAVVPQSTGEEEPTP